jgi:hypothetical protein
MKTQRYVERMLEIENLTDQLGDDEADWLLNWGAEQFGVVLGEVVGDEEAGRRANAFYAVLRKINRMAGSRAQRGETDLAVDFAALAGLASEAYHAPSSANTESCRSAARHLRGLDAEQAVGFLARWALVACDLL